MTLWAAREGENVKVQITYGPVAASVAEHPAHVRVFHRELGRLLDDVEGKTAEQRARDGYERYRASSGGVSAVSGAPLPSFDEQHPDIKGHWVAAFTE